MRRYVVNLTRLGDLLQTQPVIHALRQRGDNIALVCLENFAGAAGLLQGVDRVVALPGSALLAGLDRDWRACTGDLAGWLRAERESFRPEATLNLTPTLSARLFSRLLQPQGQPDGFSLDDHGFGRDGSPWATYVQAVSLHRGCSPFNLVDGFRCMAGVDGIPPVYALRRPAPEALEEAGRAMRAAAEAGGLTRPRGFVVFQLGASHDARRWPTSSFAALGRLLWEQAGLAPVLTGSAGERPLAERYFSHGGPGADMVGRTALPRLAAVLNASRLLVTNDTGTMHLAAGLGVPLLALFLSTAHPWDTGPYAENLCCLEPRLDCHPCGFGTDCPNGRACRPRITPDAVASLILPWLSTGRWQPAPAASAAARVWLTRRDSRNFLDLTSLSGDGGSDRTTWIRLQRRFYSHLLDALSRPGPAESAYHPGPPLPEDGQPGLDPQRARRVGDTLSSADGLLHLAREQGRLLALRPSARNSQTFLATCERLGALFSAGQDFAPLARLWRTMLQEEGDEWSGILRFFDALRGELRLLASAIGHPS